jgi:hypothetical protein
MTLKIIDNQADIKKCNQVFVRKFKPFIDEQIKIKLGHQGASFNAKVSFAKKLGIWIFSRPIKDIRYWNVFGTDKPQPASLSPITCEINFPWSSIDRKTGGAFARDEQNNIFVVHRGKIGGGRKGIGKSFFEHSYRGLWSYMEDGNSITQVAVIGVLNSGRLAQQIAQFVHKIERIKSAAAYSPQTEINFSEISFHEDLAGNLPETSKINLAAQFDRELAISSLASLFKRRRLKIGNDAARELFLISPVSNNISHLFAVVTDANNSNVLAAAAKLVLQAADVPGSPQTILILPEEKSDRYIQDLLKIKIRVVGFRLEEERIIFPDLEKIRLDQNEQL